MNRRRFLGSAGSAPLAAAAANGRPDFAAVREDFPRARTSVYFDNASCHPLSVHSSQALHRYIDWETNEVGEPWWPQWAKARDESKNLFARLINAAPSEVAFARSTVETESNLLNGMDIQASGGNVVTVDLHYSASLYNYKMRQQAGLDVRIVHNRNWRIHPEDIERACDSKTKLIAVALVSNVNGSLQDIKAISAIARSRGAYVYADIIQCAGAIPIDVKAMGIDFAACSTYKWLMGVKGYGFFYVREDLQGTVARPAQHSGGVRFNYTPWVAAPETGREEIGFTPVSGAGRYEVSYPSYEGAIAAQESLKYIHALGVSNIRAHVRSLTDRLDEQLPKLGYASITPPGTESSIRAYTAKDPAATLARLAKARVNVAMRFGNKMRIAPSVYNNHEDIDRLLAALA